MKKPKIIKNDDELKDAKLRIKELVFFDPKKETDIADELELLVYLVKTYEEKNKFALNKPDPITYIKYIMEQKKLSQQDLVPYLGSKSKVSEVLKGKRELTLKMIRALNTHLGIPADILLQEKRINNLDEFSDIKFEKYPVLEMQKIGAFDILKNFDFNELKGRAEDVIMELIQFIGGLENVPTACFRKKDFARVNAKSDRYALEGWCLAVLAKAQEMKTKSKYNKKKINKRFIQGLTALSTLKNGYLQAVEYLSNHGIKLVILPHLKRTYLDGASFLTKDGIPVIGITLRYNRIDSFWLTLLHEIGHLFNDDLEAGDVIADDMTLRDSQGDSDIEIAADTFAQDHLLPEFDKNLNEELTNQDIFDLADKYNVHRSIVAGRIQYLKNNYKLFSGIVNEEKIKRPWE